MHLSDGKGRRIWAGGIETNYHELGFGRTVILLHGSGPGVSAATNWAKVMPALATRFHVLAPDMAGFGYSERRPDIRYDIKLWVRHLLGFMDALRISQASLIGNSFGGSLALAAAARHPDRFSRLVLMGTPCGTFTMTPGLRAGWDYVPDREIMRRTMSFFPYDPGTITDELVEERYQTSLIPGAQEALRQLLARPEGEGETTLSGMPEAAVGAIEHPALVIHGREDLVIPVELGLRLARAMPNADLHVFGKCGHWVQAERFKPFIALAQLHLADS